MSASVVLFAFFKIWTRHSICHNISICYSFSVFLVVFVLNHLTFMFPVPLGKIRMNVEIWKQDEERYHIENQGTLHPQGVITLDVKWNNTMTEKNAKLYLQGMITNQLQKFIRTWSGPGFANTPNFSRWLHCEYGGNHSNLQNSFFFTFFKTNTIYINYKCCKPDLNHLINWRIIHVSTRWVDLSVSWSADSHIRK